MKIYILLFLTCFTFLAGCDTVGDSLNTSYVTLRAQFLPEEIAGNYKVAFNGNETQYVSALEATGKLEIFSKIDNSLVLSKENAIATNSGFTFVLPINKKLVSYSEEMYASITPNVNFWNNDATPYSVLFKDYEIDVKRKNYIPKDELPGQLKIVNKKAGTVLYSKELISDHNGSVLTIMPLSETEFLEFPASEVADPAENAFKIRFFYTKDAFDYNELTFDFYLCDRKGTNITFFKSVVLSSGAVSEYIEIENSVFDDGYNQVNGTFDLKDSKGNLLVDHTSNKKALISIGKSGQTYKMMTFRFTNSDPGNASTARCEGMRDLWIER